MEAGEVTRPRFAIGAGYAVYQGPSTGGGFHAHAAFQVVVALQGEVAMEDASGARHRGAALVVPPMVRHRMIATAVPVLLTFFVEPRCAFSDGLRERCGHGVTAAPELRGLREEHVRAAGAHPSSALDPRLVAAMDALADQRVPMPSLAAAVGLSPQRLRALARHQLGMPLARWHIWRSLSRAAQAMHEGQSLADAAITGGFADQAHLTRRMREMMGLTPSAVMPLLRPSVATRDVDRDRAADR